MWKKPSKAKEPENLEKAYEYAVFLLSLKLRTVGEVLSKMTQRGYSEEVIDKIIWRLKEQKYLDDDRYAEIFLENLKTYRTFGFYGVKKKLMEKKIPQELIEKIMTESFTKEAETKIAERLLDKEKFQIKKSPDNEEQVRYQSYGDGESVEQKQKQKMANKLKSRGFRGEVIAKLLF